MTTKTEDVNTAATSSPAATDETLAVTSTATEAPAENAAAPSGESSPGTPTGEGVKSPEGADKTPLDVVRSVLKPAEPEKKPDTPASTPDPASSKIDSTPPAKEGDGKDLPPLTPEEEAKLPFHKHPRWQEMVQQRNTARARVVELEEPARQFGLVQEFMTKNQLSPPEMADGFAVMAMMRNEPAKAIPVLEDYLQQLRIITGEALPKDLQERVDKGEITDEAAKELLTTRMRAASSEAEANRNKEVARVNQDQNQRTQNANAVNAWEAQTKQADPDYDKKRPFIVDAIRAATAGVKVASPAQAVEIAKKAYDAVNERFKGLVPRASVPTSPTPRSSDATSSAKVVAGDPKSPLDVVKRALSG